MGSWSSLVGSAPGARKIGGSKANDKRQFLKIPPNPFTLNRSKRIKTIILFGEENSQFSVEHPLGIVISHIMRKILLEYIKQRPFSDSNNTVLNGKYQLL